MLNRDKNKRIRSSQLSHEIHGRINLTIQRETHKSIPVSGETDHKSPNHFIQALILILTFIAGGYTVYYILNHLSQEQVESPSK